MARKKCGHYSGIGGQAVLEGVMMMNKEKYAVAVRKPDGDIEVKVETHKGILAGKKIKEIPFIRGIFNFVDSMILGTKVLNYSASFYEDEQDSKGEDTKGKERNGKGESFVNTLVTIFAVVLAVGIFIVLPYFIGSFFEGFIRNRSLMAIIEGVIRITIFLLYVSAISLMKDIRRLYRYHGAEHKCINCIEKGRPLDVRNVMRSSRLHKRCGTSFIFFVLIVSIVLFFFIRVDNVFYKVGLRILLMPVVAGISYELIRLAGRTDNFLVNLLSAPGMLIQRLTTKEPDQEMIEVAIASIEAVFDWKAYLKEEFGYQVDGDDQEDEPEIEEVNKESQVVQDADKEAQARLERKCDYWCEQKAKYEKALEFMSAPDFCKEWELTLADVFKNLNAVFVTVEFEYDGKSAVGKLSPDKIIEMLQGNESFSSWNFSTEKQGEMIFNDLGLNRYSNLLKCEHIRKITYGKKVLYTRKDE